MHGGGDPELRIVAGLPRSIKAAHSDEIEVVASLLTEKFGLALWSVLDIVRTLTKVTKMSAKSKLACT